MSKKKEEKAIKNDRLDHWKDKLVKAENVYRKNLDEIKDNFESYDGSRKIKNPKTNEPVNEATNVRRMSYELIESQVDCNIPQPKVTARSRKNKENAKVIEEFLKSELDRLPFEEMNDMQERECPIAGGAVFFIEWDNSRRTHTIFGDLKISLIDTSAIIPEPGVYNIDDMNYIFIRLQQTKETIKRKYGIDVIDIDNDNAETRQEELHIENMLTHNFVYYKNDDGVIGLFSWVGEQIIQDIPDYFARKQKQCVECGEKLSFTYDKCEKCGGKLKEISLDTEELRIEVPATEVDESTGEMIEITREEIVEVERYKLTQFPIVIRHNISKRNNLLGGSDVSVIKDQERDVNIFGTKIREKMLKGGSIVQVPKGVDYTPTDEELQVVETKPGETINVYPIQANILGDSEYREKEYQIARQTLGITDSFQGRTDPTANSGKAKEFAAAQTAGRLTSKKIMKNSCYARLFELMFKFYLAYADEPREYIGQDKEGQEDYRLFNKMNFIEKDDAGKYYYNDQYIYATDSSATLSSNREAMWQEIRGQFQSGAYGNVTDIQTLIDYWSDMELQHYPGASRMVKRLQDRLSKQEELIKLQNRIPNMEQQTPII